jgi:WD40 repeat protein
VVLDLNEGSSMTHDQVVSWSLLDDGRIVYCIASEAQDFEGKSFCVWNPAASGAFERRLDVAKGEQVLCALGEGRLVSSSMALRVWCAATGACESVLEGHTERVTAACALGAGRLVSASADKTLRVWRTTAASGARSGLPEGHAGGMRGVFALGDGRIASEGADRALRVWCAATGECEKVLPGRWRMNSMCAVGGGAIAGASDEWEEEEVDPLDGEEKLVRVPSALRVWQGGTWSCARLQGHTGAVRGVCALGDGRRLVSASSDATLRVWDAGTGQCEGVLRGHTSWVGSVCALGSGRVVSASGDGTLRVWQATGECVRVLEGHTGGVCSVFRLGSGPCVVSAAQDGTLRVWDGAGACLEAVPRGSPRAAELEELSPTSAFTSAAPLGPRLGSAAPPPPRGPARRPLAPWGALALHLGADLFKCILTTLPSGRFVTAFTTSGAVHTLELVEAQGGSAAGGQGGQ